MDGTADDAERRAVYDFMVQAVNGVRAARTIDNNLGENYRHGALPGPPDPGAPAAANTSLAFSLRLRRVRFVTARASTSTVDLNGPSVVRRRKARDASIVRRREPARDDECQRRRDHRDAGD